MRRIEQVNELLRKELGLIISREFPLEDGLVTVNYVECSPKLESAKVGISVIPDDKQAKVIKNLRRHSSLFTQLLHKKTKLGRIPMFIYVMDKPYQGLAD